MRSAARFVLDQSAAPDRAIQACEYPNAGSRARSREACRRNIPRDLEFLRDRLGVPFVCDARRHGYTYSNPDDRLPFLTLTEGEMVALSLAERVLQQYRDTPYAPDLARAFRKITAGLTERVTVDLGHLGQAHSFRTTALTPLNPGLFRDLDAAIRDRRQIRLHYWSASHDATGGWGPSSAFGPQWSFRSRGNRGPKMSRDTKMDREIATASLIGP